MANDLNQYTQKAVRDAVDVIGTSATNATVTVNNQPTDSWKDGSFYKKLSVTNGSTFRMKLGLPRLLPLLGVLLSSICPLFSAETSGSSAPSSESLFKSATDKIEHRQYEEARNRLSLFRMLDRNFQEWRLFLDTIMSPSFKDNKDASEELNRLLLNYLTFAYTIREHFEVSFRQRYRKDENKLTEYDDYLKQICGASWAFAFFLDFRGYVQHRGLAVGRYSRKVSETSVTISVVADSAQLTQESRNWSFSKLDTSRGEIDLIVLLREFHMQMLQSYATRVITLFFDELVPANLFYARLTQEAHAKDPQARMVFHDGNPLISNSPEKASFNLEMIQVPNNLFSELGIKVSNMNRQNVS